MADCYQNIVDKLKQDKEAGKNEYSDKEIRAKAREVVNAMQQEVDEIKKSRGASFNPAQDGPIARDNAFGNKLTETVQSKKGEVLKALVSKKFDAHESLSQYKGKPKQAVLDYMRKIETAINNSVDTARERMLGKIDRLGEGVQTRWIEKNYEYEYAKELDNLSQKNPKPGSVTGHEEAYQVAKIVNDSFKNMVGALNRAGADIRLLQGFRGSQFHDQFSTRYAGWDRKWFNPMSWKTPSEEASFQFWHDKIVNRLDHEKMFGDVEGNTMSPEEKKDILMDVWKKISSGEHELPPGEDGNVRNIATDVRTSNLAKKVSKSRELFFTPEGFVDHNSEFGTGSMALAAVKTLSNGARNAEMLKAGGLNPGTFLAGKIDELKARYDSPKISQSLNSPHINAFYKLLSGQANHANNPILAKVFQEIRAGVGAAKLPFSSIRSMPDVPNAVFGLKKNGMTLAESYSHVVPEYTRQILGMKNDAGDIQAIGSLGKSASDILDNARGRDFPDQNAPGFASRALHWMMKANRQLASDRGIDNGMVMGLSQKLHSVSDLSFAQVLEKQPPLKSQFENYGINENHWDFYRKNCLFDAGNGKKFMLPEFAQTVPDSVIIEHMKADGIDNHSNDNISRYRDDLDHKMSSYITEQATFGVPRQGIDQRVITTLGGLQKGTWAREIGECVMHFKGTPITSMTKILPNLLRGGAGPAAASVLATAAAYIASTTGLAIIGNTMVDLAHGVKPRYNSDNIEEHYLKLASDAIGKGGGFGLYADVIAGEYSQNGQSFSDALLGPEIGQVSNVMNIKSKLQEAKDVKPEIFKTVIDNSPYVNLPLVRTTLNYLILDHMQENLNPGYLERRERTRESAGTPSLYSPLGE